MSTQSRLPLAGLASLVIASAAPGQFGPPNRVPSVVVTLENSQPARGVFLTPPWVGIHDGTFDLYDNGSPASVPLGGDEIEQLAEDGNNAPLAAAFASRLPNAPQRAGVAGPFGPLGPGERVSVTLNVDPATERYLSFAAMVIPSNDAFIANGNPLCYELFDAAGRFVGQDVTITGAQSHDAGTEVNDELASNVAFLNQAAPDTGVAEAGTVQTPSPGFAAPGSLSYPNGVLNYPVFANADFNDADDRLLTLRFRFVDLGRTLDYSARLSTRNELQAAVVTSGAKGLALVRSRNAEDLRVVAIAQNLSGPIQAAHLHLGQAGTNGPVVVNLGAGIRDGGRALAFVAHVGDLTGPLAGASFVEFLNEVVAGNVYLNLHTAAYPGGEVRGQVELDG